MNKILSMTVLGEFRLIRYKNRQYLEILTITLTKNSIVYRNLKLDVTQHACIVKIRIILKY